MTKQTIGIAGLKVIHAEPTQPVAPEVKKDTPTKPKRTTKPKTIETNERND